MREPTRSMDRFHPFGNWQNDDTSSFHLLFTILASGGFLERWGNVAPEQPSIRAGERHQTPHIVYARERWRSTW